MYTQRVMLLFGPDAVNQPITYNLVKRYDIVVNILQAKVFPDEEGQLILELRNENRDHVVAAIDYLEHSGITVKVLDETLLYDESTCIDCGACTGVCPTKALTMDKTTWSLTVAQEKCLLCGMCVAVCPVRALALES